jgi:ribose transport system ATP-binding protein
MGPLLEVRHLARAFGSTKALADCSVTGTPGTVHCILGENGSGKSTLVKILSGVLCPDSGEICVTGERFDTFTPTRAHELGIATVFQELLNVPNRSVVGNVLLGVERGLRHSTSAAARTDRARSVLGRLGLGNLDLEAPLERLPLAARQQVAIARALQRQPRILILDEATSALDVEAQERLFGVISEELVRNALVLFITHRMDEIVALAHEVTVVRNGSTVAVVKGEGIRGERLIELMSGRAPAGGEVLRG